MFTVGGFILNVSLTVTPYKFSIGVSSENRGNTLRHCHALETLESGGRAHYLTESNLPQQ